LPDPALELAYETGDHRLSPWRRRFPSLFFYLPLGSVVWEASRLARRGLYDDQRWNESSARVIRLLERAGARFRIEGIEHFASLAEPCVFVANHMSTLETFVLPSIIVAHKPVTFVVKKALVDYPVFRHVMLSRRPVVVARTNAREDFQVVMEEGLKRLRDGTSIVVFPQTTRTTTFDPEQFNTLGTKLARRAGVPVVPVAVRTDAWGNGRWLKELGPIDPSRPVRIAFGPPQAVAGNGHAEHLAVISFIKDRLQEWGVPVANGR
jgi:1-acyl-sn-glycerol-3-phosphate acyltransferase